MADLSILDPVLTTAAVTFYHSYAVFDTLYGVDSNLQPHPQMVSGHEISDDQLTWTLTLRDGLTFHDGTPVLARDAVASIRRWGARDVLGIELISATEDLSAPDDKHIVFKLKRAFPLLPFALGKPSQNMLAIMPERLASTEPTKAITEMVGSGPFRFLANEWVPGSRAAYERFDKYVPRSEPGDFTAGAKKALVERVEYSIIPDVATAAAALMAGEVDVWDRPNPDFLPALRGQAGLKIAATSVPDILLLRFNHLHAPFNDPAVRQALLPAVDQTQFMTAGYGADASHWSAETGFFNPVSTMANKAGLEALTGPRSIEAAREALKKTGYDGTPVVLLDPVDIPDVHAATLVTSALLEQIGFKVDLQAMDLGTLFQRRAVRKPVNEGGWNLFLTVLPAYGSFDPSFNYALRGNGEKGWFGWPTAPRIEELRQQWLYSTDEAEKLRIAEEIQRQALQDLPYVPLGSMDAFMAISDRVTGFPTEFPRYYNVDVA